MANRQSFGRRANAQPPARAQTEPVVRSAEAISGEAPVERNLPSAPQANFPSLDPGFQKRPFNIPWRQLSLMASLCFGIASFVLPAAVNDNVQWLLYALMAASLYAGFSKRRRKAAG